jgi:hypothetical protein
MVVGSKWFKESGDEAVRKFSRGYNTTILKVTWGLFYLCKIAILSGVPSSCGQVSAAY